MAAVFLLAWAAACDNPADAGDLAECLREHPASVRDYSLGDVVVDSLVDDDCRFEDRSRLDVYRFVLASPRTVTITLRSDDFDAYLVLADSDSTVVVQNDDFELPASTDARIIDILPAGTYYIGVNSLDRREKGVYTLSSVGGAIAAPAADRAAAPGPEGAPRTRPRRLPGGS
jgi:hypothetical protein